MRALLLLSPQYDFSQKKMPASNVSRGQPLDKIEYVENHTRWRNTSGAQHGANLFQKAPIVQ